MNVQQFQLILKARRRIVLVTMGAVCALTLTVSLLLPKTYTATASLVIDGKDGDPISGLMMSPQLMPGYLATQTDIIASHRVALRVVDGLKMTANPKAQEQFHAATDGKGSIRHWLADVLLKKLDVKPTHESSVISLSYSGSDPNFAAALANAFADAYIQTNLELKVEPARQNAAWYDEQIKSLRGNLEQAQARLSAYQSEHGIVATDERLDVENARLAELSSQLVGAQAQTYDSQSRQHQAAVPGDSTPEVLANPLIQGLKVDLSRQEAKLTELAGKVGRNHPQYEQAQAELDTLRMRLERETRSVRDSLGHTARAAQQREGDLRAAVAAQKARVLQMREARDQVALLTRAVDNAQRTYDAAVQRLDQSRLESRASQTNVALLNEAVPPNDPSSPRLALNMILAIIVGGLLGVGIAFLREMVEHPVRSPLDLEEALDLPVLGVVGRQPQPARRWWPAWAPRLLPLKG